MKYSLETTKQICHNISEKLMGRAQAAQAAGVMSYDTIWRWMKTKSEFSEAIKKAEREKYQKAKEVATMAIFRAMETHWQAAAWYLERKYPEEFARKQIFEGFATNETLVKLEKETAEILGDLKS